MGFELPFPRTAIVTGGARRIGAALVAALAQDGWDVLLHCHGSVDDARALAAGLPRVRIVEADLALADPCAAFRAVLADMPMPGLLVNNASRFVADDFEDFSVAGWDAHFDVNLRAPALLTRMFGELAQDGGVVINLLDAKLAALNPDFFSYTLSKIGLAGLTELTARILAPRAVRVCGIAPAITLPSGPQSETNFEAVHAMNPLGRGIEVADIIAAMRFIIESPRLTGQTILLDAGQRFMGLSRDVQYMETQ